MQNADMNATELHCSVRLCDIDATRASDVDVRILIINDVAVDVSLFFFFF